MEKDIGCRVIIQGVLDIQFEYIHIKVFISNTVNVTSHYFLSAIYLHS